MEFITERIKFFTGIEMSLDILIVSCFLLMNLAIGLYSGRGIKTIKEYAVGNKQFSTATLSATVIATCIGGGFFSGAITESYRQGLYFIIPAMGEPIALILVGYFLAPRMAEFLKTLSVAEAMGDLYGKNVRLITAFFGICLCIGIIALQFKVCASVLQVFLGVNGFYAVLASAIIIIIYSSIGGIKSVTITDILQFFTFCAIIPIISLIIWGTFDNSDKVLAVLTTNELFDLAQVFDIHNHKFRDAALLAILFLFPEFQPVFFQRVIMATNANQARKAFIIAGFVCLAMLLVTVWVSVLMLADGPAVDPNNLLPHMINKYSYTGFKGFAAVGIMAIVMSTADSYINSAAVLFSHDIYKVIKPSHIISYVQGDELRLPRISAAIIGLFALIVALKSSSILELLVFVLDFYGPIVSVPLLMSIFGFRTTSKSVLIGMVAGFITIVSIKLLAIKIEVFVPALLASLTFLIGSHYILRQEGGWVGVGDDSVLREIREERKAKIQHFCYNITNFNLLSFFKNNIPKNEATYTLLGVFCIISVFSTIYSLSYDIRHTHNNIIDFIYHSVIISSAIFISYPVWPPVLKRPNFIAIFWNIALSYSLIFVPALLVIISNFGQLQLMVFMINLIMIAMVFRWNVALLVIFIGVFSSLKFYSYYMSTDLAELGADINLEFKVTYILLLFISVIIAFIRPTQEAQKLAEEKAMDLWEKVNDMDREIKKAENIKTEFLNNLNREVHTPITCITSLGQALWESYDDLPENKRKEYVYTIAKSADGLISIMKNILELSTLTSLEVQLNLQKVNLSYLVKERITQCKRLYLDKKPLNFVFEIYDNLYVNCDQYHIGHTIDNLVINAINCSKDDATINISLKNADGAIEFVIRCEGIDIFRPFTVCSNVHSRSGSKRIGLAFCHAVLASHNSKIWAESDGESWAAFKFCLK